MRYHLFQKFFGMIVKIKETFFLSCLVDSLTHTTVNIVKGTVTYFLSWCSLEKEKKSLK